MTNAAIREQLHRYIDVADDAKVAEMYSIIEKDASKAKYTTEELAEFYNRLEKYNNGEMQSFSLEEAHNYIRANKKVK